jgi:hypothetical protein
MNPSSYLLELYEPLPDRIQIGRCEYPTIEVCRLLEILCNKAIIKKGSNRLRNGWRNTTVELKIIPPEQIGDSLKIVGKGKTFELTSMW